MSRLRQKILNANDIKSESVKIPEWNVEVEVRSLTGLQRAKLLDGMPQKADGTVDGNLMQVMTIIECTYDPKTGERVFEDADRDTLRTKNAHALDALGKVALRLAGMDGESKNGSGANGGSTTASPETPAEPSKSS